jgi:uncharacterized protein with NRDE domain
MCLIAFALDSHPLYRLVLMANRDEFLNRETLPAAFWSDAPRVLAGRDLQAGGTWLGVTIDGKLAAITNYRDPRQQVNDPPSRGMLVADYLRDDKMTPADLHAYLQRNGNRYDGFNLIYGTTAELHYFTNRGGSSGPVSAGIHGLSNHLLDTRWPKLVEAKARLERLLRHSPIQPEDLLAAMTDPTPFRDELLPDTGVGPEFERFLSPLFICGERYATRSTTVILVGRDGQVTFREWGHDPHPRPPRCFSFAVPEGDGR